jgi:hypothetical protein
MDVNSARFRHRKNNPVDRLLKLAPFEVARGQFKQNEQNMVGFKCRSGSNFNLLLRDV